MDSTQLVEGHEGRARKMYLCSAGYHTIGVGHNLDANPIPDAAVDIIRDADLADVYRQLDKELPWWRGEDTVRQAALIDLCFNMGIGTLKQFVNTLAAWVRRDYERAATGLQCSKWFSQVGHRGPRIVGMVRTGKWPS